MQLKISSKESFFNFQHFLSSLIEAQVPTLTPYKCPKCPHFSPNRLSIYRHWFEYHHMMEIYTAQHFGRPAPAFPADVKEEVLIKDEPLGGDWNEEMMTSPELNLQQQQQQNQMNNAISETQVAK